MSRLTLIKFALFCLGAVLASTAFSAEGGGSTDNSELVFIELTPDFVTNYDGGGRLKYLKTTVTLRVDRKIEGNVRHHLPYIRNKLVMLFTSQLEENLTSTEGKEKLRRLALGEVRKSLEMLEGIEAEAIVNLYFPSFVIQQ